MKLLRLRGPPRELFIYFFFFWKAHFIYTAAEIVSHFENSVKTNEAPLPTSLTLSTSSVMCPSYRRRLGYRFSRRVSTWSCCPLTPGSPIRGDAADNLSGLTTRGPRCSYLQAGGGEMTNFIFGLITLSVLLIGTPSSQDRYSTLRCRAALGSDTLLFFFEVFVKDDRVFLTPKCRL